MSQVDSSWDIVLLVQHIGGREIGYVGHSKIVPEFLAKLNWSSAVLSACRPRDFFYLKQYYCPDMTLYKMFALRENSQWPSVDGYF